MHRNIWEKKIISLIKSNKTTNGTVNKKIKGKLKEKTQEGLNTLEIASRLNIDRHTAIKYLEAMESKGVIHKEIKRRAKVWKLSDSAIGDFLNKNDIASKQLKDILNTVDHHISIQDKNLGIIWKNDYAKTKNKAVKCHEAYFESACKCDNCPVEKTFSTGKSETREFKTPSGLRKITTRPLKDENDETLAVVEIIKDIK
jgi:Mn-dependent DtxR family transcriptional regulator